MTKVSSMWRARQEGFGQPRRQHYAGSFPRYTRRGVSPGLALVPQELSIGKAIENILAICEICDGADLENRICLVPSLVMYRF